MIKHDENLPMQFIIEHPEDKSNYRGESQNMAVKKKIKREKEGSK